MHVTNKKDNSNYFVHSVEKAFDVLSAFDANSPRLTLGELAEKTGINKATVRRFALTLCDLGYLNQINNSFQLSPKILNLGQHYLESLSLPNLAHPILEKIANTLKDSTNLGILDGSEVVYVARITAAERIIGANLRVGSRLPYYATSIGKAIVAWLPETTRRQIWENTRIKAFTRKTIVNFDEFEKHLADIRIKGYAFGDEELEEGLRSVAMPVFNRENEPIAAINVSTHALRTDMKTLEEVYVPTLKEGIEQLNKLVGFQ